MSVNIDQNSRDVGKGVYYDKGSLFALPLSINPVNQKLLIEIIPVSSIGTKNVPSRMPIDASSANVSGGLTNDSNEILTPLSTDSVGSPVSIPCLRVDVL